MSNYKAPFPFILKDGTNNLIIQSPSLNEIEKEIRLFERKLAKLDSLHKPMFLYRGEPEIYEQTALLPSIFRCSSYPNFEKNIFNNFFSNHNKDGVLGFFHMLARMQHFGFPTRLLDWTYELYVGLYLACQCPIEKEGGYISSPPLCLITT